MKKLLLLFLVCSISLFGQQKTISVEYKAKVLQEENLFKDNEYLKKILDDAIENSRLLSFELIIKDNVAKFEVKPNLILQSSYAGDSMLTFLGYSGVNFIVNDSVFKESSFLGNSKLVKKSISTNWKLTNETKKIGEYLCFKATNTYVVIGPNKIFNHPVVAWFCPSLPYSFGPIGYGGLPGLILELQVRKSWFGVDKIDFNSKVTFSNEEFTKKEKIIEDELDLIIKKQTEDMFKD